MSRRGAAAAIKAFPGRWGRVGCGSTAFNWQATHRTTGFCGNTYNTDHRGGPDRPFLRVSSGGGLSPRGARGRTGRHGPHARALSGLPMRLHGALVALAERLYEGAGAEAPARRTRRARTKSRHPPVRHVHSLPVSGQHLRAATNCSIEGAGNRFEEFYLRVLEGTVRS